MKKFEISARELFAKCDKLVRVINAKNTLPILDKFYFKVTEGRLSITASDSENYAVSRLEVTGTEEEGTFMLEARQFVSALKEIPEQPLTVTVNGSECVIKYNNGRFSLPVYETVDEYPVCPPMDEDNSIRLSGESFRRILSRVSPFVAADELRPVMNGICFSFEDGSVDAVASDGHGLAKLTEKCTCSGQNKGSFILSTKSARLAETFLSKDEKEVFIDYNRTHSHIRLADFDLYNRLVEGLYPNYNSVIPVDYSDYIEFNRMEMMAVVRRTVVFSSSASLLLKFHINGMMLDVTGQDIDFSTLAESSITIDKNGYDMTIGLKGTLLQRALGTFTADRLCMYYKDASRAVLFRQEDQDAGWQLTVIVMPMMLND